MIKRQLEEKIREQLGKFPVIAITGPRQSGKTTLATMVAQGHAYYNLEDLNTKKLALSDPVAFISGLKSPVIIDEIQKLPELLSQIQVAVDLSKRAGQFIITGSESLLLSDKISQSLAGRVVNNTLLPLSYAELKANCLEDPNIDNQLIKGFYPRLYTTTLDFNDFYPEYISTYVEKDVRQVQNIGDLALFEKLLQLLAGRVGQLLNLTSLSNDLGISHTTVERWISLLEASYIVFRLQPYYENLGKRLVKSPKVYFYDTGLLTYLLGISNPSELKKHFAYGSIFENFVITEVYKKIYNQKLRSKLYFYRDSQGTEVDLLITSGVEKLGLEIKSAQTFSSDFTTGLTSLSNSLENNFSGAIVYQGVAVQTVNNFALTNINNLDDLLEKIP